MRVLNAGRPTFSSSPSVTWSWLNYPSFLGPAASPLAGATVIVERQSGGPNIDLLKDERTASLLNLQAAVGEDPAWNPVILLCKKYVLMRIARMTRPPIGLNTTSRSTHVAPIGRRQNSHGRRAHQAGIPDTQTPQELAFEACPALDGRPQRKEGGPECGMTQQRWVSRLEPPNETIVAIQPNRAEQAAESRPQPYQTITMVGTILGGAWLLPKVHRLIAG